MTHADKLDILGEDFHALSKENLPDLPYFFAWGEGIVFAAWYLRNYPRGHGSLTDLAGIYREYTQRGKEQS